MPQTSKPATLPDPDEARREAIEKRDKAIALEVVRRGEKRGDRAEVADDLCGGNRYQVTRAMKSQGEWARTEHAKAGEGK